MSDLAVIDDVEKAWRPLSAAEKIRAEYYLGTVSRAIRRRWATVDQRIADEADLLTAEDVSDVVVQLVIAASDGPIVRGAKSWSESAGPQSKAVTLETGSRGGQQFAFEQWMVDMFDGAAPAALPTFYSPPAGRYEGIFIWPEGSGA